TLDYAEALAATNALLQQDQVIIFEAAVTYANFFIRADILVKRHDHIELIEVKAKSFAGDPETEFYTKKGGLSANWRPYLMDVAFQKYVVEKAFPGCTVSAYLMLADKDSLCPTDGLNQKFKISKDGNGRKSVIVSAQLNAADLADQILVKVNVDSCCAFIYTEPYEFGARQGDFASYVQYLADHYARDEKIASPPSVQCGACEFKAMPEELAQGLKSGWHECWQESVGWREQDFNAPTVLEIWNCRKKQNFLQAGKLKMTDLTRADIGPHEDGKLGISASERQWLQVAKVQNNDHTPWLDRENLAREMDSWVYPLHFIDFETTTAAIPFNRGRHPYEGIAFQFSHHVVDQAGRIEHRGQYSNAEPGVFPNYEFVRRLKEELSQDNGSIFRYAAHENSYLNQIYRQLQDDPHDIIDRDELCAFIRSITTSVSSSTEAWEGKRSMIDMCELVKRYYYDPATRGSNSIKQVLPAILNSSEFLQRKYVRPIYGSSDVSDGIPSLNYRNWTWIKFQDGKVVDPYKLLPNMFEDISAKNLDLLLSDSNELRDGGAALTAYARMQFEEMSDYEREAISKALLKYCELDTLAMVMIYEGWRDLLG
ncbi:MAG: DUF2779 domain-containing protein, partial [Peptococcaceae bacterium]|nr:DUF2779 domain-containing protein [Peptococcaceae bacterium]